MRVCISFNVYLSLWPSHRNLTGPVRLSHSLSPDGSPRAKCTSHLCSFLTASTGPLARDRALKLKRDIAIFHPGKNTLLPTDITLPQGHLPGDVAVTNLEIKGKPRTSLTWEEWRVEPRLMGSPEPATRRELSEKSKSNSDWSFVEFRFITIYCNYKSLFNRSTFKISFPFQNLTPRSLGFAAGSNIFFL